MIDKAAAGDKRAANAMKAIFEGESNHISGIYDANTVGEASYGPFQLNKHGGLGARFQRETGLDPANPSTAQEQANWVASYIRKGGSLSAWRGYQHGLERIRRGQTHPNATPMNCQSSDANTDPNVLMPMSGESTQDYIERQWRIMRKRAHGYVPTPGWGYPRGHEHLYASKDDPLGFHANARRYAQNQGSWSNSTTTNNEHGRT